MNGLIDQARTYLWKIVNDMTLARQNGKLPDIRLALYEYGNDGLSSRDAKPNTLEDAIIQAVRQQASKKQFSFVEENETEGKDSPMNDRVKK